MYLYHKVLTPFNFRLGLLSNTPIPEGVDSPLDALAKKLFDSLMLPKDESDVVIMSHNVGVRWPTGKRVCFCSLYLK